MARNQTGKSWETLQKRRTVQTAAGPTRQWGGGLHKKHCAAKKGGVGSVTRRDRSHWGKKQIKKMGGGVSKKPGRRLGKKKGSKTNSKHQGEGLNQRSAVIKNQEKKTN